MPPFVEIDGNMGEGGGQVLRIAICLSALYKIPVSIKNIRVKRPKIGLQKQHLKGMELVKEMCGAKVKGGYIKSTYLEFEPGQFDQNKRVFVADAETAGSICLLAQVALPCALFFPCNDMITLILKGGTNVGMAPQIEYLTRVFRLLLNKFGANFDFKIEKRGYYPKGGGEVHIFIKPIRSLNAVTLLDVGVPQEIVGWCYAAGAFPIEEAQKMASNVEYKLKDELKNQNIPVPPINIVVYKEERTKRVGDGCGINIVCRTSTDCILGGSNLFHSAGKHKVLLPAEKTVEEVINPLKARACVDEHAEDQMIILMALAKGTSKIKIGNGNLSSHTTTAMNIAEIMLKNHGVKFETLSDSVEGDNTLSTILQCQGCGYINEAS